MFCLFLIVFYEVAMASGLRSHGDVSISSAAPGDDERSSRRHHTRLALGSEFNQKTLKPVFHIYFMKMSILTFETNVVY